jgi:hypothetical protein
MSRKILIVFIVWQAVGALGACLWQVWSSIGAQLWGAGFLLLLPGNIIAAKVVEGLLWQKELSLRTLGAMELVGAIAINFVLCWGIARIVRRYRWRMRIHRSNERGSPTGSTERAVR